MPRTANGLHDYLAGSWRLARALRYVQGGVSGTFAGEATFESLQPDVLGYLEAGQASLGSPPMVVTATQRYVWDRVESKARVAGQRGPSGCLAEAGRSSWQPGASSGAVGSLRSTSSPKPVPTCFFNLPYHLGVGFLYTDRRRPCAGAV